MPLTMQRLGKGLLDCQEKGVSMAGEMIVTPHTGARERGTAYPGPG